MGLVVPNPNVPTDGQPVEATTLAANLNAVYNAIQSFDGSQIQSGTVVAGAMNASINPNTLLHDTINPFVQSGCVWSQTSGFIGTMTGGVLYTGTSSALYRVSVTGVGSNTFTASKDTYVDIDYNGNITYSAVANNATSPALTANSIRVAKIITNGSTITSIVQNGVDGVTTSGQLNFIYNTSAGAVPISIFPNSGSAGGSLYYRNQSGIKELWGQTNAIATNVSGSHAFAINFPSNFFNAINSISLTLNTLAVDTTQYVNSAGASGTGMTGYIVNTTGTGGASAVVSIHVRGL